MTQRQLFLNAAPPICGYASHAKTLAILTADDDYRPWYFSNYIQTCCKKDFSTEADVPFDFFIAVKKDYNYYLNNPWLFSQVIRRDLLASLSQEDLLQFIIRCIDAGYYVDIFLNQYCVPERADYRQRDYFHDNLIFGYDLGARTLDVYGFNGKFVVSKLGFDDFLSAYYSCPIEKFYQVFYLYHIEKVRGGSPDESYRFDLNFVIQSLNEYVSSFNSSRHFASFNNPTESMVFGLDTYGALLANLKEEPHIYDIRPLQILYEHKACMAERCRYLYEQGFMNERDYRELSQRCSYLRREALNLRNLQIKEKLSPTGNLSFLTKLLRIQEYEQQWILDLIKAIS